MNKLAIISVVLAICFSSAVSANTCTLASVFTQNPNENDPTEMAEYYTMDSGCTNQTRKQIQKEIGASMTYLSMAAHFSHDSVNRPGFAKFFFEAASEEREHAYKLIEYLSMRGNFKKFEFDSVFAYDSLIPSKVPENGLDALKMALEKEQEVTNSIKELIKECEREEKSDKKENDYHFVDYLTGEFLEEQFKGQRDLAGKISTLGKMMKDGNNGKELAEFLFDKQLL